MPEYADDPRLTPGRLRAWALLRIARGDSTGDPELDAAGFGTIAGNDRPEPEALAEAAIRLDRETVTAALPSGLSAEMILGFDA